MTDENNYAHVKLPKKVYDKIEQKVTSMYVELGITSVPIDPFDIAMVDRIQAAWNSKGYQRWQIWKIAQGAKKNDLDRV